MISKPNKDDASTATGRNARFPLLGMLMLSVGLLLSMIQPAMAQTYNFTATITVNNQVADGTAADVVQVYVTYASGPQAGQPANNVTVDFLILPSTASNPTVTGPLSFADGYVIFPVSNTVAGPQPVKVIVNGVSQIINLNFIPAPVVNNPPPGSPNPSFYTTIIGSAVYSSPANSADTTVVQVHATDGTNNELPGTPVRFTLLGGTGGAPTSSYTTGGTALTVGVPYTVPGGLGQNGSLDLPIYSSAPGTDNVEVEVWNGTTWVQIGTPQTVTFNIPPPPVNPPPTSSNPPYYITIIGTATANNSDTAVVQLHVTDGTYNEPDGYKVQFQITSNNTGANATMTGTNPPPVSGSVGTTLQTVLATNANGSIDIPITDPNVGDVTIAAFAWNPLTNAYDIPVGTPQTVHFVPPPPPPYDPTSSWITPVITPQPAGGQDEVEIHLASASGPLINVPAALTLPSGVSIVNPQPSYTTDVNGNIFIYLTSTVAGPYDIVATYMDPSSTPAGQSYTLHDKNNVLQPFSVVVFTAAAPSSANSYIVVTQDGATDDGVAQDIVTAYLYDQYGNAIIPTDNPSLSWSVSPNTPANAGVTSTPGSNVYTVAYTSTTQGPYQVSLQVNGVNVYLQGTTTPATIHFVVGQPVTGDPGGPSDGGSPGGGSPGNGGTPPDNGGGGSGPGGGGGIGSGPGSNNGFTVLYVLPQYNDRLNDGQQQDSVFALITDATKNPVPNVTVTFYIQNPGGTITSGEQWTTGGGVSTIQVTTGPDGIARAAMTSTATGSVWVYASIVVGGTDQLIAGSDAELDFVTKPDITNIQTALTVIVGEALADGQQQNVVKAHVVDLDGNVMPNQEVYFAIDSGSGTIVTPQPVMTDANGDALISITSKTVGYVLITAVVDNEKIVFGSPARVYFAQINIYVPRVFTPNNDGTNDLLKPILVGITTFHYFNVYNRWGNLVYTSQDPNQGWDGTFKGVPQPVETYLWIAEGIDENGRKVVQKGMTSLVR